MNIFHKVTLQSLIKNRTRTVVTIIGVALSAAMITAVATFGVSLIHYMTQGAIQKYGGWHAAFLNVDSTFVREQAGSEETASAVTFENIGYAPLEGGSDPGRPYLFIAGFHEDTFDALPITLLSGRMPENSSELLISGSIATKGGVFFAIGDTLTLAVGSRMSKNERLGQSDPYRAGNETLASQSEKTYTVVGICRTPVFEELSAPGYTVITRSEGADTTDSLSLFVTLKNPRRVHSYVENAAGGHASILNANVLRFMGLSRDPADKIFTGLLYSVGAIVIAIIMIGSIFLIYNSFNISLNERIQQFGILASVGATAKQLRNSVLFEGLCVGAAGIPIGVAAGIGSIGVVISIVAKNFGTILYDNVPFTLSLSIPAIAGAAAVSMATILISAHIPAKKAANTPVMECIRQTNEVKVESKAVKISKLAWRIYGLEGTLALKNFKRNRGRYRSIVLSLILSIVLFMSTSAFVKDFQQVAEQARSVTDYDIAFGTQDMDDSQLLQLYNRLKTVEGVTNSSYQFVMEFTCAVRADQLTDAYWASADSQPREETLHLPTVVQFLDDITYQGIITSLGLPLEDYTGQNKKVIAVAKMQDNSGQAGGVSQLDNLFTSDCLTASLLPAANGSPDTAAAQTLDITCVEIVPPDMPPSTKSIPQPPYFFQVLAPYSLMEALCPFAAPADLRVKGLTFQSDSPSQTAAEMKTMIQDAKVTTAYLFMNTSEIFEESRNYIFIANVFAYTFIIMISLIAAANVFNTISTNIKLRRRELAMLRSVGMSDRDFNKMMRFECALYGMKALLFGLPIAAASSWLIYKGMLAGGAENIRYVFPWASMGVSVFSVLLVILVTMMYAVGKIKKENIIDALRDDMT